MSPLSISSGMGTITGTRYIFAPRMAKTPKSFIREILKVTGRPEIISFAGGLPNPDLIDVEGIRAASMAVFEQDGQAALQYSTTEGYLPLRQFIADRYSKLLGDGGDNCTGCNTADWTVRHQQNPVVPKSDHFGPCLLTVLPVLDRAQTAD